MLRRWLGPRALLIHVVGVVAVGACAWLCVWQYHRAIGGNDLSWAYVFEWPLFGCCAIYVWWDMIHNPEKRAPVMWASTRRVWGGGPRLSAGAGQALGAGQDASVPGVGGPRLSAGAGQALGAGQDASVPGVGGLAGLALAPADQRGSEEGVTGAGGVPRETVVADEGAAAPSPAGEAAVIDAAVVADFVSEEEDPKLAAYNRYLAELHTSGKRKHW